MLTLCLVESASSLKPLAPNIQRNVRSRFLRFPRCSLDSALEWYRLCHSGNRRTTVQSYRHLHASGIHAGSIFTAASASLRTDRPGCCRTLSHPTFMLLQVVSATGTVSGCSHLLPKCRSESATANKLGRDDTAASIVEICLRLSRRQIHSFVDRPSESWLLYSWAAALDQRMNPKRSVKIYAPCTQSALV